MLQIKLLKVTHSGSENALKLIPYIQNADIFALEEPACTMQLAQSMEGYWQRTLHVNYNITEFQKSLKQRVCDSRSEYEYHIYSSMYKNKTSLWFPERFSINEAKKLETILNNFNEKWVQCLGHLVTGNVSKYLEIWEGFKSLEEGSEIRDTEIGRNLSRSEGYFKGLYNSLRNKEDIRVVVSIGGVHKPERYTTNSVEIVDLRDLQNQSLQSTIMSEISQGKSFEEVEPLLINLGAIELSKRKKISLMEKEIKKMSTQEILSFFKNKL